MRLPQSFAAVLYPPAKMNLAQFDSTGIARQGISNVVLDNLTHRGCLPGVEDFAEGK
jgi:hypothetical protein